MKKIIAGIGFEITGVMMVLFSTLIASMSLENTSEWNTQLGRYWQTVYNLGLIPIQITGIVLLIAGISFPVGRTYKIMRGRNGLSVSSVFP